MGSTLDNLKEAFAGESQANRKYLAFAKKADEEGLPQAARLFRAAAAAETVHAHNHLKVIGDVKSTMENLKAAYEGEHHEFTTMYPEFLEKAKARGTMQHCKPSTGPMKLKKSRDPSIKRQEGLDPMKMPLTMSASVAVTRQRQVHRTSVLCAVPAVTSLTKLTNQTVPWLEEYHLASVSLWLN